MLIEEKSISKIILSGEHAVVYGYPAIALPFFNLKSFVKISKNNSNGIIVKAPQLEKNFILNKNAFEKTPLEITVLNFFKNFKINTNHSIDIEIYSEIPIASGMGSGASISASIIKSLAKFLSINITKEELFKQVFEIEKIYHGTPSGIDPQVIIYEKPCYFIKNKEIEYLDIKTNFSIAIINSGIKSTTKKVVDFVREQKENNEQTFKVYFSKIGEITNLLKKELLSNKPENIGALITENQFYLSKIGVSNETLDYLIELSNSCGSLGTKISGAGMGGIIIAIIKSNDIEKYIYNMKKKGVKEIFVTSYTSIK